MKRAAIFLAIFAVGMSVSFFVFAANKDEPKRDAAEHSGMPMPPDMEHGGGMGMGSRSSMMNSMMMMQVMREKSIVSTSDGGVLVVIGNQMMKYDKDLNLVKEAELKIDMDKLRGGIGGMMPSQPPMREGMTNLRKPSEPAPEKAKS